MESQKTGMVLENEMALILLHNTKNGTTFLHGQQIKFSSHRYVYVYCYPRV